MSGKILMWLFFLFLVVPIIEIAFFIQIGDWLGLFPTLLIVIITAALGATLVRLQALNVFRNKRFQLSAFQDLEKTLADGGMILLAGALLLTPGFFTDIVGFLLLTPWFRARVFNFVKSKFKPQKVARNRFYKKYQKYEKNGSSPVVIEGEYRDESHKKSGPHDNRTDVS